ncbi:MAG: hypothetical protein B7Z15_19205, partial [Rhizobiales bacterium 32-66-8]
PFATMMSHIRGMASDIAAMEVLGPNPNATLEWLKQTIRKEAAAAENGKPSRMKAGRYMGITSVRSTANLTIRELDGVYQELRGGAPVGSEGFAAFGAGIRNFLVAAKLGGATLSAVSSDPGTVAVAKGFIGMPVTNTYWNIAKQFSSMSRREAIAAGLIHEESMHVLREQARYAGSLSGPEWTRVLPDRVLTWNGLAPWTQAVKHAFGRDFQAYVAGLQDRGWNALPPEFRRVIEGYGFKEKDWSVIQRAQPQEIGEARFLRFSDIDRVKDPEASRIADRWSEMIHQETEYAVPSGTARGRAIMLGTSQPGTISGEFARSFAMFKSFGVSVSMLQGARVAAEVSGGRGARGAAYAGSALITLTLGGMLGNWLKDIAAGKDPRPVDSPGFVLEAMLQGGGLGIYGDFLLADYNRFGNSLASTIAGPVVGLGEDVLKLTAGQFVKLAKGEPVDFPDQAQRML